MKCILNHGASWAIVLLLCLAASAQTPPDTNAVAGQGGQSQYTDTNAAPATNQLLSPAPANPYSAGTNLNYLLGVTPAVPPMTGPGTIGSGQLGSPLAGTRVFATPPGATAGAVPVGPGIPVWGPVLLHPSLSYGVTYATSVASQPGQRQDTVLQTISAGFLFDIGSHWTVDYVPSYSIYSANVLQDTLSHALSLSGGTTYRDWTFSLSQSYFSSSESLLETGAQTSEEGYETAIGAVYAMGSKLTLQLGADQSIRDTTGFDSVDTWSGNAGLSYMVTPQLRTGLSLSGGYNAISTGSDMPFESVQGTLAFQPGQKLALFVSGGAEEMQFVNPSAPDLITPIFSASVQYFLSPQTTVSLAGSRSVTPSFFGNQVQVTTSVGGSIRQILSPKWTLALNAGYTTEPLTSIVPQALPQFFLGAAPKSYLVEDETIKSTSVGLTLSYAMVQRVSLSAFVSVNDNSASQANYKYTSTQVGFSASYTY